MEGRLVVSAALAAPPFVVDVTEARVESEISASSADKDAEPAPRVTRLLLLI